MTGEFDDLFTDHSQTMETRDQSQRPDHALESDSRQERDRWLDDLVTSLQPVAAAAIEHGHQASVVRNPNRSATFEIRFKEHPALPASCTFAILSPPNAQPVVYIDSDGPGRWDDPCDPVRHPLATFTMDDAREYVARVIRSASKLLP